MPHSQANAPELQDAMTFIVELLKQAQEAAVWDACGAKFD
jgi:hypothetical protein